MLRRALLTCVAIALVATGTSAGAKTGPAPQIVDPKGDAAAGQAALDIVSVQYSTTGVGAGKTYVPKKLIVALTLAAPPDSRGFVSYSMRAMTDTCGQIWIKFSPGTAFSGVGGDSYYDFGSCTSAYFASKVAGSVVTFSFGLKMIGIDRGTEFSEFTATVDASDPAIGIASTGIVVGGLGDDASGDGTWVIP